MKKSFSTILFLSLVTVVLAQKSDIWSTLSMVTITSSYNADYGYDIQTVAVSPVVQAMEGKEIEISGYIIPLTGKVKQSHFMLSSLPANMCFFCGKAGPETAMQVFMKDEKKLAFQEEKISLRGKLFVNPNSADEILYTLEDAVVIQ